VYAAFSSYSVCGLQLLVYEAFSYLPARSGAALQRQMVCAAAGATRRAQAWGTVDEEMPTGAHASVYEALSY